MLRFQVAGNAQTLYQHSKIYVASHTISSRHIPSGPHLVPQIAGTSYPGAGKVSLAFTKALHKEMHMQIAHSKQPQWRSHSEPSHRDQHSHLHIHTRSRNPPLGKYCAVNFAGNSILLFLFCSIFFNFFTHLACTPWSHAGLLLLLLLLLLLFLCYSHNQPLWCGENVARCGCEKQPIQAG